MPEFLELTLEITPPDGATFLRRLAVDDESGAAFGPSELYPLWLGEPLEKRNVYGRTEVVSPLGRIEVLGGEPVLTAYSSSCDVTLDGRAIGELSPFDVGSTLLAKGWSARLLHVSLPPASPREYEVELRGQPKHRGDPYEVSLSRFEGDVIVFGRVQGNDVTIPKGNVSKRHCELVLRGGYAVLRDRGSSNGTYMNGTLVRSPTRFDVGDKLYLGDFTFELTKPVFPAVALPERPGKHHDEALTEPWRITCEKLDADEPLEDEPSSFANPQRLAPHAWLQGGSPHLEHVRAVHLRGKPLTQELIARIRALPWLTHLNLFAADVSDELLAELLEGGAIPNLTTLELGCNPLTSKSAELLANSSRPLEVLDLYDNRLGPNGVEALLSGSLLPHLKSLNLCGNGLDAESLRPLASRELSLSSLSLGYNLLGDDAAQTVASMKAPLERLNMRGNGLTKDTAAALAKAAWRDDILYLGLEWNPLGDEGGALLLEQPWAKLRGIQLSDTEIELKSEQSIANGPCPPRLARLNLSSNPLNAEGVTALMSNPAFRKVELRLYDSRLSPYMRRQIEPRPLAYGLGS